LNRFATCQHQVFDIQTEPDSNTRKNRINAFSKTLNNINACTFNHIKIISSPTLQNINPIPINKNITGIISKVEIRLSLKTDVKLTIRTDRTFRKRRPAPKLFISGNGSEIGEKDINERAVCKCILKSIPCQLPLSTPITIALFSNKIVTRKA